MGGHRQSALSVLLTLLQVDSIERHPGYRFPFIDNDIAVLTLAKDVSWSKRVSPVCLPGSPNNSFASDMAELAGWG